MCKRKIELQWLLSGQRPNYHSIADFRKVNSVALQNTFKLFVLFLKEAQLIGGKSIAIDGTKVRASNSKKNNFNLKKIKRHLTYIETKTAEYLQQLSKNDKADDELDVSTIQAKIERLKNAKIKYEALETQLNESIEPHVSTTDADARALLVHGQVDASCLYTNHRGSGRIGKQQRPDHGTQPEIWSRSLLTIQN